MTYKLQITKHAEQLFDNLFDYLVNHLDNKQAAKHFADEIENVYHRLEENPEQFPLSRDPYFAGKSYREAVVSEMNYIVIFTVRKETVTVLGIFHQLENYYNKL